jgi:hypothetical protein
MAVGGRINVDQHAIDVLVGSPAGPVGKFMARLGEQVTQEAKRRAPVSPRGSGGRRSGYLRSEIGWSLDTDGREIRVHVMSPARTNDPRHAPYGYFQSLPRLRGRARDGSRYPIKTTPHLQPALDYVLARYRSGA